MERNIKYQIRGECGIRQFDEPIEVKNPFGLAKNASNQDCSPKLLENPKNIAADSEIVKKAREIIKEEQQKRRHLTDVISW